MKKLVAIIAFSLAALCAQAASTDWSFTVGQMYASDGTSTFTGKLELFASGGDLSSPTVVYSDASAATTYNKKAFSSEVRTAGEKYNFYLVLTDGGKQITSDTKEVTALGTGTAGVAFGSLKTLTQNTSNWAAVPEPTSALLLMLGVAGLALKRKRV